MVTLCVGGFSNDVQISTLARVLPLCSSLQTLLLDMPVSALPGVLSELSHPLHAVRHFTLSARGSGAACKHFKEGYIELVLAQFPSLSKFATQDVYPFSARQRALWDELAPNCEVEGLF